MTRCGGRTRRSEGAYGGPGGTTTAAASLLGRRPARCPSLPAARPAACSGAGTRAADVEADVLPAEVEVEVLDRQPEPAAVPGQPAEPVLPGRRGRPLADDAARQQHAALAGGPRAVQDEVVDAVRVQRHQQV